MEYEHLRIKDKKIFWKLKEEAVKMRLNIIEATEEAIKFWLKNKQK